MDPAATLQPRTAHPSDLARIPADAPLQLLPMEALVKTSSVDHADWNFRPLLGAIQRMRFKFARELLGPRRVGRLLEIGYGSGIFLPELARHCDELHGIDIHDKQAAVTEKLASFGVTCHLQCQSATQLPFPDRHFDRVVAVSSLEFIDDLDRACSEIQRVLRPGGRLIVVTPGHSAVADLGLKLLTGESASRDYGERRQGLIETLLDHFDLEERRTAPWLYTALRLQPPRALRPHRASAPRLLRLPSPAMEGRREGREIAVVRRSAAK